MKKIIIGLTLICFAVCGCDFNRNSRGHSITSEDNQSSYSLDASYPKDKTLKVINYIESDLKVSSIFAGVDDEKDMNIEIPSGPKFHLKASPGHLKIELDKKENSYQSYQRIKKLCLEVRDLIIK